jgi:hypothetical protein
MTLYTLSMLLPLSGGSNSKEKIGFFALFIESITLITNDMIVFA